MSLFEYWILSHRCYPDLTQAGIQSIDTTLHLKVVADLTELINRAVPDKECGFDRSYCTLATCGGTLEWASILRWQTRE